MSTYVLVHGAWHGAWSWEKVVPLLEAAGHRVLAPDLPSHGSDDTPISEVTLDAYVDRVCEAIDSADEPVLLVGHSMGGVVVTQTGERRPGAIAKIVYVSGFLPGDGQALLDIAGDDEGTLVLPNLVPSEDGSYAEVRPEALRAAFFADLSDEDAASAIARLSPQPLAPFVTPVETTDEGWGSVPRVYFECIDDRAISITRQREMQAANPCEAVVSFESSHSPFYSQPQALAEALLQL